MKLSERLEKVKQSEVNDMSMPNILTFNSINAEKIDKYDNIKTAVHREVIDVYNQQIQDNDGNKEGIDLRQIINDILVEKNGNIPKVKREKLLQEIYDDIVGLGPLEPLLRENEITEIMVNGPRDVYVERHGKIERTGVSFRDNDHIIQIINRIVSPIGRRCDESNPMVDARLKDGSRVNAIIPPLALNGPTITIRKFNATPYQISDLIEFNSLSFNMASFLEACVKGRCNVMVSGGTGSGKTTLLNVLSSYIPDNERIITIEDSAELRLMQDHVITLEFRPSNAEGKGAITIRDLVRNSLRMRPDRIIVGEVRSGEALDMLQAMNTGHDGSLATAHANSARDLIARLETMVMMAGMELPIKAIRQQITSAIDIIVQQSRFRDGSRKIISISEVTGMEGDVVSIQDIFVYKQEGYDTNGKIKGKFVPTGIRPHVADKLRDNGVMIKDEWFMK